jgi:hypothetical protein
MVLAWPYRNSVRRQHFTVRAYSYFFATGYRWYNTKREDTLVKLQRTLARRQCMQTCREIGALVFLAAERGVQYPEAWKRTVHFISNNTAVGFRRVSPK